MGYKVRVVHAPWNYKRDYGTGRDGRGKPFVSKAGAEKRAEELRREKGKGTRYTVSVIKV